MNLFEAERLAKSLIAKHLPGEGWTFKFNRRKSSFGLCSYTKREIQLSKPLTEIETLEHVENTILHEIAHAIAGYEAGHGYLWKVACMKIGMKSITRTSGHSEDVEALKPSWVMVCPRGKIVKRYKRKPNAATFYKLPNLYIPGRKAETMGNLMIMEYRTFERRFAA